MGHLYLLFEVLGVVANKCSLYLPVLDEYFVMRLTLLNHHVHIVHLIEWFTVTLYSSGVASVIRSGAWNCELGFRQLTASKIRAGHPCCIRHAEVVISVQHPSHLHYNAGLHLHSQFSWGCILPTAHCTPDMSQPHAE